MLFNAFCSIYTRTDNGGRHGNKVMELSGVLLVCVCSLNDFAHSPTKKIYKGSQKKQLYVVVIVNSY